VDAAYLHSFIGYESSPYDSLGRPLKLDRQEVIAVVVALRAWLNMDHEARIAEHRRKAQVIQEELDGIPYITMTPVSDERTLGNGLRIGLDEAALGKTAAQIIEALREGTPSIWMRGNGNSFNVAVSNLLDDEVQVVVERLRELLGS
jgi:seryl-tRNA(Sec) selenium transferase